MHIQVGHVSMGRKEGSFEWDSLSLAIERWSCWDHRREWEGGWVILDIGVPMEGVTLMVLEALEYRG